MNPIPVVLSTDENYWVPACVTIASLVTNAFEDTVYDIYILYSGDILTQMEAAIERIYTKTIMPKRVHFVSAKDWKVAEQENLTGYVTGATFYRLYIAEFLKEYEKCLYIDVDVVVRKDLTELYNVELGDCYLAGVKDQCVQEIMRGMNPMERMGLESVSSYINAGILVMNLTLLRRDGMVERFVQTIDKHYLYDDQGILNHCCYGRIKHLPVKYNLFQRFYGYQERLSSRIYTGNELEGAEDPAIVHQAGSLKPWNNMRMVGCGEWWGYLDYFITPDEQQKYRERVVMQTPYENWNKIISCCKSMMDVVIFGCGKLGKQLIEELLNCNIGNIKLICDNGASGENDEYQGISITSVEKGIIAYPNAFWVISSQKYAEGMRKQLLEYGVAQERICEYITRNMEYLWVLQRELYAEEVEQLIQQVLGKSCEKYLTAKAKVDSLTKSERDALEKRYEISRWMITD